MSQTDDGPETPARRGKPDRDLGLRIRDEDPDRWLATRLVAGPRARCELIALYAFYAEVAAVARRVRQPLAGELRLAWWLESIARAKAGEAVGHPVIEGLATALREDRLPLQPLERIVEARRRALDPSPEIDDLARTSGFDDTTGALMEAAAILLDPVASPGAVLHAGRAWGWSGVGLQTTSDTDLVKRARLHSRAFLTQARVELRSLPVASFPAVAYLVFMEDRLAGRRRAELSRRIRLLSAAATGRV